jgi:hypothetical protein
LTTTIRIGVGRDFDQDRMLAAFEQLASGDATGTFPLSRMACFGGEVVIDMIRTHPMIVIGGILQENPLTPRRASSRVSIASGEGRATAPFPLA